MNILRVTSLLAKGVYKALPWSTPAQGEWTFPAALASSSTPDSTKLCC